MSGNPIVRVSLASLNQDIESAQSNGDGLTRNLDHDDTDGEMESAADGLSPAERQLQYFESLRTNLLCDYDEEYKSLAAVDNDDCIKSRLKYFHKFATFMFNDRVIAVTIFLQLYYIIVFGIMLIYLKYFKLIVFYVSICIVYMFSILCIKAVKGRIFGKLIHKTKGVTRIGYYQLLNMKHMYVEKQHTVNNRRGSIGIISGKFVPDVESDNRASLRGTDYSWMSLLFINFTANFVFFIFQVLSYEREINTKYVYYYYFFLWSSIDRFTCFISINYLVIIMASMIYAASATQMLCYNWTKRLDKYRKISMSRYEQLMTLTQKEGRKNGNEGLPTVSKIQLDLFERYLFIVGALVYTSRIFNGVVAIITGGSIFFFMIFAYCLYTTEDIIFLSFMWIFRHCWLHVIRKRQRQSYNGCPQDVRADIEA